METLEESNAALRQAVETRLAGSCCDGGRCHTTTTEGKQSSSGPEAWKAVIAGAEPARLARQSLRPGSEAFIAVLDEVKRLHLKKTLDYGQDEDALSNIRSSADVVNVPAWAGCIIRISDKMHRLRSYFRRGVVEFDGIEDTLLDICSYAAIALVLYREMIGNADE